MSTIKTEAGTALDETLTVQNSGAMAAVLDTNEQPISEKALEAGAGAEAPSNGITSNDLGVGDEAANADLASYTLSKRQQIGSLVSMCMLTFIASLDATIMASIYVPIASDFDALGQAVWILTTYMLSSTIVQAIIGKISDILGRVETTQASIIMFILGSILCGASQSMNMLIASRTIQGVGGGGILGLTVVLLGDIFSERERGKYMGALSSVFGLAVVIGPVMGGGIVEHASWRIVFWINIPICVIAMALIFFTLKLPKTKGTLKEKVQRVDFIGCTLFTIGMVPILLGLSWGGQQYEWTSAQVLACLICGFVVLLVFGYVEYHYAVEPIVPAC
ncbi:hypothetical protein EC988_001455 [Linderina pennispora]|nr:hypothetical protein EC988_001455 [Linderina pennispora]